MKVSKANAKGSLVRDEVGTCLADARNGVTYAARCSLSLKGGRIVRVWSIFTAGIKRPRKAAKGGE